MRNIDHRFFIVQSCFFLFLPSGNAARLRHTNCDKQDIAQRFPSYSSRQVADIIN